MWLLGLDDAQLQSGLGLRPEEIAVLRGGSSRNLGRPRAVSVCRQSISDSWLGNLRECLAHLVKGSGCDCLLMQAASLLDGFSFDLFPPFKNGLTAPEVDGTAWWRRRSLGVCPRPPRHGALPLPLPIRARSLASVITSRSFTTSARNSSLPVPRRRRSWTHAHGMRPGVEYTFSRPPQSVARLTSAKPLPPHHGQSWSGRRRQLRRRKRCLRLRHLFFLAERARLVLVT